MPAIVAAWPLLACADVVVRMVADELPLYPHYKQTAGLLAGYERVRRRRS